MSGTEGKERGDCNYGNIRGYRDTSVDCKIRQFIPRGNEIY